MGKQPLYPHVPKSKRLAGGGGGLNIRCPICQEMVFLTLADWEHFIGFIELGKPIRISLECLECRTTFLLQATLTQVVEPD